MAFGVCVDDLELLALGFLGTRPGPGLVAERDKALLDCVTTVSWAFRQGIL